MSGIEIIEAASLERRLFEEAQHGGIPVSFFVVDKPAGGGGNRPHVHPYDEVFVLHEGEATLTIGGETVVAVGGQIVVAPRGRPHRFSNTGPGSLRVTCIHRSLQMVADYFRRRDMIAVTDERVGGAEQTAAARPPSRGDHPQAKGPAGHGLRRSREPNGRVA